MGGKGKLSARIAGNVLKLYRLGVSDMVKPTAAKAAQLDALEDQIDKDYKNLKRSLRRNR